MLLAFLAGVRWGAPRIAAAWLVGYPALTAITAAWSLPAIGVRARALAQAVLPPVLAGIAMALVVTAIDRLTTGLPSLPRLALLTACGGAVYLGWMTTFARPRMLEMLAMLRRSDPA